MVIVYHTDLLHNLLLGESRQLGSCRLIRVCYKIPQGRHEPPGDAGTHGARDQFRGHLKVSEVT